MHSRGSFRFVSFRFVSMTGNVSFLLEFCFVFHVLLVFPLSFPRFLSIGGGQWFIMNDGIDTRSLGIPLLGF